MLEEESSDKRKTKKKSKKIDRSSPISEREADEKRKK